ncbi:hypothetical protein O3P69_010047 [Scylla paramamosain]|uniref:Uncharacterized protein n=1 Tax=Scylla paramamosain TaxID=85552 RepID=A0AAW0SPF2_SCYPA
MPQMSQDGGFSCDHDWSMLTGERSATGIMKDDLLMLNLFPEVPTKTYSSRNEIIFVIDRSGEVEAGGTAGQGQ